MILIESEIKKVLAAHGFSKKKLAEYAIAKQAQPYYDIAELVPFADKELIKGILLFEHSGAVQAVQFVRSKIKPGKGGVSRPIICDFCFTLQPRSNISLITFPLDRTATRTVAYYVCADLVCSLHVRGVTDALVRSKSQLREDISPEDRIQRFADKTAKIFETNNAVTLV